MNKVDLLFVMDVTGSMGHLISSAKKRMQDILEALTEKYKIDVKVGMSLYRDHPSQDSSFVTAVFDLMSVKEIKKEIDKVWVGGGGDAPEAVIDGLIDGVSSMSWRSGSRRICFLIGDAPAHGMTDGELCCQCGKTWGDAINTIEDKRVSLYTIVMGGADETEKNFKLLANFTGGILIKEDNAMDVVLETLSKEFEGVNLDSQILGMLAKNYDKDKICKMLGIDRDKLVQAEERIAQYA